MSPGDALAFGLLVVGASLAFLSALELDASYYRGEERSAWLWGITFLVSSLLAAFGLWRLV